MPIQDLRMADYSLIVRQMRGRYQIRIRRWRRQMTGCAWRVYYDDGRAINWIEAPKPKTPISLAIFLHEVGHHAIGFATYKTRCEEEYHAWMWALTQMQCFGVQADEHVWRRFDRSMRYAVGKAVRRGIKRLPESLVRFCDTTFCVA
jgi:hypothetical protein